MARVLVSSACPDGLESLSNTLEGCGHSVLGTTDGIEALCQTRRHWPDALVVTDGLRGLDVPTLMQVMLTDPDTSIIPVLGVCFDDSLRFAGCTAVVSSPAVDLGEVARVLEVLLQQRSPEAVATLQSLRRAAPAVVPDDDVAHLQSYVKVLEETLASRADARSEVAALRQELAHERRRAERAESQLSHLLNDLGGADTQASRRDPVVSAMLHHEG